MKFIITSFLIALSNLLSSQTYFDFRVGTAINYGHGSIEFPEFLPRDHEVNVYPYLNYTASTKIAYASPYLSVLACFQKGSFFELQMGLSYLQYKQSVNYGNLTVDQYNQQPVPFNRTVYSASGLLVYNIFRYEITPTLKLKFFKISFGILNIDFLMMGAKNLSGTKTNYHVIPSLYKKNYSQYYGYVGHADSVVTLTNTENIKTSYNFKSKVYIPLSFGIESEIKVKKQTFLVGAKIVSAFHKNYYKEKDALNYYQFLLYIGTRIASKKTAKNLSENLNKSNP